MPFFVGQWILLVIGWGIHVFADRQPHRRTRPRVIELALLWVLVAGGVWGVIGALGHIGPYSVQTANQIGYAPSMFQWEVGWGDLALSVLGIGCAWRRLRGTWLTAAVVALTVSYGGDAIGHLTQLVVHDNRATSNVWSLPSDILQPLVAIALLVAYRRTPLGRVPGDRAGQPATVGSVSGSGAGGAGSPASDGRRGGTDREDGARMPVNPARRPSTPDDRGAPADRPTWTIPVDR